MSLLERKARRVSTGDGIVGIVTVASLGRASVASVVLIALLTKVGVAVTTPRDGGVEGIVFRHRRSRHVVA